MSDFRGIVPAIITPFTPTGGFNEQAYRKVMEANIEAGSPRFLDCRRDGRKCSPQR